MTRTHSELTLVEGGRGGEDASPNSPDAPRKKAQQTIGDFLVPYGYEIWGDGLYSITAPTPDDPTEPSLYATPCGMRRVNLRRICHQPIWIRRFGRLLDSCEQLLEIAYKDALSDDILSAWVDRLQIASKPTIIQLAKRGMPVTEGNCLALMHYLDAALHLNGGELHVNQVLQRTGAHQLPEGMGWLIGERWIGPYNTRVVSDPRNIADFSGGFTVSGEEEQWFSMFKSVAAKGPVARWIIYASFAPPLLRLIDERSFIIHHWGESGSGKTALAKFAMSAWGDPHKLMMTFNRTEKSFTETFRYLDDVPVLFDELQASNRDDILKILYLLCLEQHRGRAGQTGGLQERGDGWHTVIRMTGEEPVIGRDGRVDLGGVRNRTVQIGVPVLDPATALEIHKWLAKKHFGWGAMRFLHKLVDIASLPDGHGKRLLQDRFVQIRDEIVARSKSPHALHARVGQLAVVALAQYLANRWFFDVAPELALEGAIRDATTVAEILTADEDQESLVDQALQLFHDHFVGHRHLWFDLTSEVEAKVIEEGRHRQLVGMLTQDEVWLVQREANSILSRAGFPPKRVWSDLQRLGFLHVPQSARGSYGVARRRGSFYAKVYVLTRVPTGFPTYDQCYHKGNPFKVTQ